MSNYHREQDAINDEKIQSFKSEFPKYIGDFLDNIFRHIAVKAGNQGIRNIQRSITGCVGMDSAVVDFLRPIRHGQRQTPIQQTAK